VRWAVRGLRMSWLIVGIVCSFQSRLSLELSLG
jgi:hypothetical protein